MFPGNILEESLDLFNKSSESIVVRLKIDCLNEDYDKLEEYVFSARKVSNYDYNDKLTILIPPFKSIGVKIAQKVPIEEQNTNVRGMVNISI